MAKQNPIDKLIHSMPNPLYRPTWFDGLPRDLQEELQEVKDKYVAGGYACSQSVVIKAIRQHCAAAGKPTGEDTVRRWLRK